MFGVELTHHGEDFTFETMLKRFGLSTDRALQGIAQIVHDIDLKDGKFNRLEAEGLNAVITGLSETAKDDRKLLQQSSIAFDGLYALFSKSTTTRRPKGSQTKRRKVAKTRD